MDSHARVATARRSATVVAVTPVVVAYVARHHFDTLLSDNPEVRDAVTQALRERAAGSEEPIGDEEA